MVFRIFFQVGHGLFAMEHCKGINSIYDCGSTKKSNIESSIDRSVNLLKFLQDKPTDDKPIDIDNLFISHYDKDHVNGLKKLLSDYNVKRIFLPMLSNLSKLVCSEFQKDKDIKDLIIDPEKFIHTLSPNTIIILIEENSLPPENISEMPLIKLSEIEKYANSVGNITYKCPGCCKFLDRDIWLYIIYNRRVLTSQEQAQFMQKLIKKESPSDSELINELKRKDNKTSLKKILNGILTEKELQNINEYSMVVWSGECEDESNKHGCLYTGDYNTKKHYDELDRIFFKLKSKTEIIQVPHHGSIRYFTTNLYWENAILVISAQKSSSTKNKQIVNPTDTINKIAKDNHKSLDTTKGDIMLLSMYCYKPHKLAYKYFLIPTSLSNNANYTNKLLYTIIDKNKPINQQFSILGKIIKIKSNEPYAKVLFPFEIHPPIC